MPPAGYVGAIGALRYLMRNGGLHECPAHLAAKAGLAEVPINHVAPGVIGQVSVADDFVGWTLGICIEPGRWAVKD